MDRCIIIGAKNGFPKKKNFTKRDYIIAADGGLEYCIQNKIVPDYIVGDFDSFGHVPLELLKEPAYSNTKLKQYPREKDDTDTAMAIAYGQEMGYRNFVLMGCQGGRIDHTIANIQCMKKLAQQNIKCVMYGDD